MSLTGSWVTSYDSILFHSPFYKSSDASSRSSSAHSINSISMRDVEYWANTEPEPQKEKQFHLRGLLGAPGIGRSEWRGVKKTVERVGISKNHLAKCYRGTCADEDLIKVNLSDHLKLFWAKS